jgi:hypothetical protein
VVVMLLCPAKLAKTKTLIPLLLKDVRNVLRPECEDALLMPARL